MNQDRSKANPQNAVECGRARFTMLTSRMIRMEYAEDGIFEDRSTFAVFYRDMPAVEFQQNLKGDALTIDKTSRAPPVHWMDIME